MNNLKANLWLKMDDGHMYDGVYSIVIHEGACVHMCVCACVRARGHMRACVRACVHACMCVCVCRRYYISTYLGFERLLRPKITANTITKPMSKTANTVPQIIPTTIRSSKKPPESVVSPVGSSVVSRSMPKSKLFSSVSTKVARFSSCAVV